MAKNLYAVTRRRGDAWDRAVPMEKQWGWGPHAEFMTGLETEGFVLLGGPLEDSGDILLIVRADNARAVAQRLAGDPWSERGLLETARIAPWTLRMGSLG